MAPTSCDKCRSLKVKCTKVEVQSACSKCLKSGYRCVTTQKPLEQRQRAPKERVHLRDLATRIDGVLNHLTKSDEDKATSTSTDAFNNGAGANLPEPTPETSHQHASTTTSSCNDWQIRLGLDQWLLAHLLQRYRAMQHYFPFFVVPESWDVPYMLKYRPTLFLAVAASASCHYPVVQQALNTQLKETLARRVLVDGDTSLELLQTVLVYLAWFQYYLVPRSQLIHRYLQIAVSMAVDLDALLSGCSSLSQGNKLMSKPDGFPGSLSESRRTLLGCYYLSSSISSSLLKPNPLPANDRMLPCSVALAQSSQLESDLTLKYIVQYQQMLENVLEVHQNARKSPSCLDAQTKPMIHDLDTWRLSLPQHLRSMGMFTTRYHHLRMRIFEMGLLYHFRVCNEAAIPITQYPALNDNLFACIAAIKDYLDTLLAMDGSEWNYLPCEEWSRLIVTFFVLYKLSVGPREVSGWDVELCRSVIDTERYLDAVADHVCSSRQILETSEDIIDSIYFVLPDILRSARASCVTARDMPHLIKPGDRVHVDPSMKEVRAKIARPKIKRGCPVTSSWADRALLLDQETDWRTVELSQAVHPAEQLAKNERLWSDLLGTQLGTGDD